MWGTSQNGNRMNRNEVNVNTRVKTFTSDTSSLGLALWNNNFSITISPAIGADGNGIMQYDQARNGKTALTLEAVSALLAEYDQKIKPIYEKVLSGEEVCPDIKNATIKTGRAPKENMIGFEMTPSSGDEIEPDLYFVLYGAVDENNTSNPAATFKHKFAKREVFEDYNPLTGVAKVTRVNADFASFLKIIGATEEMLPFQDHFRRYNSEKSKNASNNATQNTYQGNTAGVGGMNFASSPSYGAANAFSGVGMFGGALNDESPLPFN